MTLPMDLLTLCLCMYEQVRLRLPSDNSSVQTPPLILCFPIVMCKKARFRHMQEALQIHSPAIAAIITGSNALSTSCSTWLPHQGLHFGVSRDAILASQVRKFCSQITCILAYECSGIPNAAVRYNLLHSGTQAVAIVTVRMDGIWQFAEPEFPGGHVRGKVFGDSSAMLPMFALPGASLAPNKNHMIEVRVHQDVPASLMPANQEGWMPGESQHSGLKVFLVLLLMSTHIRLGNVLRVLYVALELA